MSWFTTLLGIKQKVTESVASNTSPLSTRSTAAPSAMPVPADGPEYQQVSEALLRFLKEDKDEVRLQQLKAIQVMGRKSLAPLLREAFNEQGDPTKQNINIHKIRLAVWCGCALYPKEFQSFYSTQYQTGLSSRLDEMRGINMKDGLNRKTYVHDLLASDSSAKPSSAATSTPPKATQARPSPKPKCDHESFGQVAWHDDFRCKSCGKINYVGLLDKISELRQAVGLSALNYNADAPDDELHELAKKEAYSSSIDRAAKALPGPHQKMANILGMRILDAVRSLDSIRRYGM